MSLIDIRAAGFCYGTHRVFERVALSVPEATVCCLLGANGCGKSTLIDCVLGLHRLQEGQVAIRDRDVADYRPADLAKVVAYVPQAHQKTFPYTVRQIVLMGRTAHLAALAAPSGEDGRLAEEALRQVGIPHLADRPYTRISGGEMQLVALARALAQDTPVIVMDEPTAHLDYRNELIFLETVAEMVGRRGISVLVATHSPDQAFYLADKGLAVQVAMMFGGTISAVGSPGQVLTEENIRSTYGVETRRMTCRDEAVGHRSRILPIAVLKNADENRR